MKLRLHYRATLFFISFLLLSALAPSCKKDNKPVKRKDQLTIIKEYAHAIMTDIYYWYKEVPTNVDPAQSTDIYNYFESLMVSQDKWSWMMSGEEYLSSESGVIKTYGMSLGQPIDYYNDYSVRVRYVFPGSPMADNNIKRGYRLHSMNGTPVMTLIQNNTFYSTLDRTTNEFTFEDHNGEYTTFTTSSREVNTRSYLVSEVITSKDYPGLNHNVGYFHYLSFKATMLDDIDNAMSSFKEANIKELILDLRYNGGGDTRALSLLANYIAPASANGKLLAKREHNDKYQSFDNEPSTQTIIERSGGSLDLDRLYILTTKGSASASEVLLNGLKPLMNIVHLGSQTYGKFNGMYVLPYPKDNYDKPLYVFLPVSFFTVNSMGEGRYTQGLEPNHTRPDDLYNNFGLEDDWISAILSHITTGVFPPLPTVTKAFHFDTPSIKLPLPQDSPQYGIYKVVPQFKLY